MITRGTRARRPSIPRTVGFGAGLLACALVAFSAAGAVWGRFRPVLTGYEVDDGGYAVETLADIEFGSFVWFVLLTGLGGVLLALGAYLRGARQRGLGMLLWVGVAALASAVAFYYAGSLTATHLPSEPGETVQWTPPMQPHIGWAAAPFMAMFAYWSAAFISADVDWEDDAPDIPEEVNAEPSEP